MRHNNPTLALTVASLKMWYRDRRAIFWTLFLPLLIMVSLGMVDFDALVSVDLGVVDTADSEASRRLITGLESLDAFDVFKDPTEAKGKRALSDGDRDIVLIIPAEFGPSSGPVEVKVLYNEGRPLEVQVGLTIIRQALDEMTFALTDGPRLFTINAQPVNSRNLRFIDFLMPGIVAMALMQTGLFSVTFAFVYMRQRGILRRLLTTPIRPASFIFAQVFTRLSVAIIQTLVLIGVGVIIFDVQFAGNLAAILLLAVVGGAVFLSMGFAISGLSTSEEMATPLANVVSLPMLFLSGIFFPRDVMPEFLQTITDFLPLTYLVEAMRNIAVDGQTIWSQWDNLLGLAVWLVVGFVVAARVFRWE